MSLSTVQAALCTLATTALGDIPTEWPNSALLRPVAAEKWAQVFFLPGQPAVKTLGPGGEDIVSGIFQIDLNYQKNTGDSAARADYETVRATFKADTRIDSSGHVTSCGRSVGRYVDNWYKVSISVGWYALIAR